FVKSLQPKIGALAKTAVEAVASIAGAILLFVASFIVAGIIMAFGRAGAESAESIFDRIMGTGRGAEFVTLSSATIRAVALGVLATSGILGMFIGATLLTLGYQIFMWWVAENPDVVAVESATRAAA